MDSRKLPESALSPEFIKVAYDKHGNPLAVTPVAMHMPQEKNGEKKMQPAVMPKSIPQPIEEWLVVISKNIISLRRDLANTQNVYNQIIQQVKQMNPTVNLTPIDNSINSINMRINDIFQKMEITNEQVTDQKTMYKLLSDHIIVLNDVVTSVAKEFSQQQIITRELAEKIEMLNEQLSGSFINLKTILKEIDLTTTANGQKFTDIDERIAAMHKQLASSIERTEGNIVALNGIFDDMKSRIDDLETSNFEIQVQVQNSLKEFADNSEKTNHETRNQLEGSLKAFVDNFEEINAETRNEMENSLEKIRQELMDAIEQNKIDRESLIQEVVEKTTDRMRNLIRKKAKARIKVKKQKIRKAKRKIKKKIVKKVVKRKVHKINKNILVKKLMKADIATYPSALIVTERKTQRIGRAVFDVAKGMNKNVLMIMQNKMSESDGFEPVTYDAMTNSDALFIVSSKNMRKNFSLKTLVATKPVFIVNKKMKFSEMKN
jgi:hypothetical protein